MKSYNSITFILSILLLFMVTACEQAPQAPGYKPDDDGFRVHLSAEKIPGQGQYKLKIQTGDTIDVAVNIQSPAELKKLTITKKINLEVDTDYGQGGAKTIDIDGKTLEYQFIYVPDTDDVNQLVGFTFKATNMSGKTEVSDLTLEVNLSPRDNIPLVRWGLASILHVNEGNKEVIKKCEKDNSYLFNADSTVVKDYGKLTAKGGCKFDGLKVYDKWWLTPDEEHFVIVYHALFNPSDVTKQVYEVKTLTTEELGLQLTVDLSALGLGIETFLYTYKAKPK